MKKILNVEDIVLEKSEKFPPNFNLFENDWLSYSGNGQSKSNTWINLANYVGCIYGLLLTLQVAMKCEWIYTKWGRMFQWWMV